MGEDAALAGYERFEFDDGRWTRPVFKRGGGPAVIIIHEMPGLHPLVIRFADRVAAAGMTVYLPSLFGIPARRSRPAMRWARCCGRSASAASSTSGPARLQPDRRLAAGPGPQGPGRLRRARGRRRRHVLHRRLRPGDDDRAGRGRAGAVAAVPAAAKRRAAQGAIDALAGRDRLRQAAAGGRGPDRDGPAVLGRPFVPDERSPR